MFNIDIASAQSTAENNIPKEFVEKAVAFHRLHHQQNLKPLILPNVWNPLSAKLFEQAGFKAIATTSSGIAASLGYPDGEKLPKHLMFDMIKLIANSVDIPVSVDLEAGYGKTPQEICTNVSSIIRAGVIGINIEDADPEQPGVLFPVAEQVAKIQAIKSCAQKLEVPLFINARTDVFWQKLFTPKKRLSETIARLQAYEKAGADGVFVPGLTNLKDIAEVTNKISLPLNVLSGAWAKDLTALASAGVSRISIGSAAFRDVAYHLQELAKKLAEATDFDFFNGNLPYDKLKALLISNTTAKL